MTIIDSQIELSELSAMAEKLNGEMVKAVADVRLGILAVDAELHSDLERELLCQGSMQEDLWGFNIYPECAGEDDFIEYDSLINIRPSQGNRSRSVEDVHVQKSIVDLVNKKVRL